MENKIAEVAVVVRLKALPEKIDELRGQIIAVLRRARSEPGCLAYELFADLNDARHFVLSERWASVEQLFAYNNQPYHKEFENAAQQLCAAPGDFPTYAGKIQAARFREIEF